MSSAGMPPPPKKAANYFWMYTISDVVNALSKAGLVIDYLNEHDCLGWNHGGMEEVEEGLYQHPRFKGTFPLSFSLRATKRTG